MNYPTDAWPRHQLPSAVRYSITLARTSPGADLLADFKDHVRVTGTAEDTELTRYLNVAARALEDDTRRLLISGSVVEYFDAWPWDYVRVLHLARAPVVSLTHVKYYDPDGVLQTWNSANYDTDLLNEPARIIVADGATLSSPALDSRLNAVAVTYSCGYGAAVANLNPESINAIFTKAAYLYGCGRELLMDPQVTDAVERCWQNEIRRLTWSAF